MERPRLRSQGVGRLIRSKTDTGIVAILDNRVLTKRYGRAFIESIPQCPVEIMSLAVSSPYCVRLLATFCRMKEISHHTK